MRMMLKIVIPTETGNQAIKDGSLHKIFETAMSKLKPEAAYFFPEHGLRSAMMVFDMKDASEIPAIAEPLFAGLNARLQLQPVMNADDLKRVWTSQDTKLLSKDEARRIAANIAKLPELLSR